MGSPVPFRAPAPDTIGGFLKAEYTRESFV